MKRFDTDLLILISIGLLISTLYQVLKPDDVCSDYQLLSRNFSHCLTQGELK